MLIVCSLFLFILACISLLLVDGKNKQCDVLHRGCVGSRSVEITVYYCKDNSKLPIPPPPPPSPLPPAATYAFRRTWTRGDRTGCRPHPRLRRGHCLSTSRTSPRPLKAVSRMSKPVFKYLTIIVSYHVIVTRARVSTEAEVLGSYICRGPGEEVVVAVCEERMAGLFFGIEKG